MLSYQVMVVADTIKNTNYEKTEITAGKAATPIAK
jgi:hypothetical protein